MQLKKYPYHELAMVVIWVLLFSCNNNHSPAPQTDVIKSPDEIDKHVSDNIQSSLNNAIDKGGKLDDSTKLEYASVVKEYYSSNDYTPLWSSREKWQPLGDSIFSYISHAQLDGLFPSDYHFNQLKPLKALLDEDSIKRMDAALWTRAELLFTDGIFHIFKDLKLGRMKPDSLSSIRDTTLDEKFFMARMKELVTTKKLSPVLNALQPKLKGYWDLKKGIPSFLDSMDTKIYTYVNFPYKKGDANDSLFFVKTLQKRLWESGLLGLGKLPDSAQLSNAVKKMQQQKGITADGKVGPAFIRAINTNDVERFKRIAITLDRYKRLPEKMPVKYIWVNLPGFYLQVFDHDTVTIYSKIICGKPDTRTPLLTSEITDMVTYPTWTVPTSIIAKSYLPKLKHNPNYLSRIGLKLYNSKGEVVDASEVNWAKYSRGIPFKVMQGSGDNNALGVLKFNFNNKYAVYLHDTNQRYLFKNASRAFSHGCVRVQEWEKLAFYLARNDSIKAPRHDSLRYNADSIRAWIAHKQRRRIDVLDQIPLFIRYFTCEGKDGKVVFYDDIYGEDKIMREKYFANKW